MNLNESELEDRLRSLTPAAPPPELGDAIARGLSVRETAPAVRTPASGHIRHGAPRGALPGLLRNFSWAFAGACAALAVIVALERAGQPPSAAPVAANVSSLVFDLAESSAEILAAEDEGLVYSDDEALARRVRYSSIERHVWTDAGTGAWMEIEIPREDVRLMPVAMQ